MKKALGQLRLAPTDLANHVACRHLTALDLAVADGLLAPPDCTAWLPLSMQQRGEAHERAFVAHLRTCHAQVLDLRELPLDAGGFVATRSAMRRGVEIVLQAPVGDDRWAGRADVLRRVARPSALGEWSYEPLDTKLARETRGSAILQLCAYADMLAALQGARPELMHVVAPGRPFDWQPFRVDDHFSYFALVRRRLLQFLYGEANGQTYPEPTTHCEICRWSGECTRRRRQDDHLGFVAGIRRLHIAELALWDITTLDRFGSAHWSLPERPRRVSAESLSKVHGQARVQLQGRVEQRLLHERLPLVSGEGLFRLPPPSPGDVFFDLEGDPFVGELGHEFLFGYAVRGAAGDWQYVGARAIDAASEKQAFEAFVRFVGERRGHHPDLHIYHYAPYEAGAMRRLTGKHAVCEDEVDRLLRGRIFVDLYAIVRQAVRASVERYSIKDLEPFYDFRRSVPLSQVGQHLRAIQLQLEAGDATSVAPETWSMVEGYNRDDCLSARDLRVWLESLRQQWESDGFPIARPAAPSDTPDEELAARDAVVRALMARLLRAVPAAIDERSAEQQGRWLLAQLLEFHRREDKAVWWEFYRLAELPASDALDEPSALGGLQFVARVGGTKKCPIDRYRFPPQELARPRGAVRAGAELKVGAIAAFDGDARTIEIKKTTVAADVHPEVVFFHQRFEPDAMQDALLALGTSVSEQGLPGDGPLAAVRGLLFNSPPLLADGTIWHLPDEPPLERARRLAVALDRSVLPVQGPPGSGKTYTGAHMACALVRAGRKVGIVANSHRVIRHLLETIVEVWDDSLPAEVGLEAGAPGDAAPASADGAPVHAGLRCIQKISDDDAEAMGDGRIVATKKNGAVLDALQSGEANVAAGTAWMWARAEFREAVDVLIVDEAGQMSLANVLAAGQAAQSLVLLGDPQQLEQPLKGSHPVGTDVSVLEHILGAHKTLPDDRGLFLAETWRLAPALCAFTSELFYEGRLRARPGLERQRVDGPLGLEGPGLWHLPVEHAGNQSCSLEEADAVRMLVERLVAGAAWTDSGGVVRPISLADILIVAPYNAQVYAIQERLPKARVGTVDRFQGQEAAVVVYSMTTSSPEDAPRGMEFLYSLNRLNVATSRARCAVVLVANPRLFEPDCQTPRQMRLANAFCRYLELAKELRMDVS